MFDQCPLDYVVNELELLNMAVVKLTTMLVPMVKLRKTKCSYSYHWIKKTKSERNLTTKIQNVKRGFVCRGGCKVCARPALTGWAGGQGPFAWAGTRLDGATHAARARGIDAKWLVCFLH